MLEITVKAADSKHAEDIVALDMQEVSLVADYFVIMDANSERQVEAIVDEIVDKAEEAGIDIRRKEGRKGSRWILIDMADVVVHVFLKEEREFYNLEKLWSDAPMVNVSQWVAE
ncbi:ribosome silencing factor [Agrilactobacillus yilanensis]|uniref:Ribosomal silencing factor RsfS n=1 Tax=Agrilactobacillus yilanensis TaxID=2485997 RepID=A0ABW4JA15_9LACO|nr:ribosome silencing factor [Agrilactobacillus yilanensis]